MAVLLLPRGPSLRDDAFFFRAAGPEAGRPGGGKLQRGEEAPAGRKVKSTSPFVFALFLAVFAAHAVAQEPGPGEFAREVDMRLEVPLEVRADYSTRLEAALARAQITDLRSQYFVLVDRSRLVQAVFIYWRQPDMAWHFIGASPVSTGRPGEFGHFLTPLGVFEHSPANLDFRAEGTRNSNGVLGYGRKGMRIYDFGDVIARRTWGRRDLGPMRLQMHATDPDLLEPLLGGWHSKGCVRIPASFNLFIDRYGLLDAEYEAALRGGAHVWVLRADRKPTASPGRWLVVIDSERSVRPPWAPAPPQRRHKSAAQALASC